MRTSAVEVTNVSPIGFWLLLDAEELFVPFARFPWFENATIQQLVRVQRPSAEHLHWPDLDVDLAVESIRDPDRYPLVSRVPTRPSRPARAARARDVTDRKSRPVRRSPRGRN